MSSRGTAQTLPTRSTTTPWSLDTCFSNRVEFVEPRAALDSFTAVQTGRSSLVVLS